MALEKFNGLELPAAADMHVHLRDGAMTDLVVYVQEHLNRLAFHLNFTDLPYEEAA